MNTGYLCKDHLAPERINKSLLNTKELLSFVRKLSGSYLKTIKQSADGTRNITLYSFPTRNCWLILMRRLCQFLKNSLSYIYIWGSISFNHMPFDSSTYIFKKVYFKSLWSNYTIALYTLFRIRFVVLLFKVDVGSRYNT